MEECHQSHLAIWQCPPFLFLIMGFVTILAMLGSFMIASRYIAEPEIAALIVIFIAFLFIILGNLIITGFNRIALANRMKTEFVSIASHQLRSPLSIFKWTLEILQRRGYAEAPEKTEDFMRTLRETTERMIRIVNSLLEVSRIEAGVLMLKPEIFNLSQLTDDIVKRFDTYARASGIVITHTPNQTLPAVTSDRERISMVIENLISNAIQYTAGSGTIKIIIEHPDGYLRWSITDEGRGIAPNQQLYIFGKFFRADGAGGPHTRGTGLGLYIAKSIIEASRGTIGFTSVSGKGSTFWFTLPIHK